MSRRPAGLDYIAFWRRSFAPEAGSPGPALAFPEVFEDMVGTAADAVASRCPEGWDRLSAPARRDLGRGLLQALADLCAQPLQRLYAAPYDTFVAARRAGGLEGLLAAYPGLVRLAGMARDRWIDATSELLQRLATDAPYLEAQADGSGAGPVMAVETDLSDRHDGGRTVASLGFGDGRRLIYKPRDMGMEGAYNDLLGWLNSQGPPLPLRALRVMVRSGYGWVEAVGAAPCASTAEVTLHYRRAGMLLALWWLLEGADAHMSNVAACGADPVLLDAETFFQATGEDSGGIPLGRLSFLPKREPAGEAGPDVSGLGGTGGQVTGRRVPVWWRDERGEPRLEYRPAVLSRQQNEVILGGARQRPTDHAAWIEQGCREMCRFVAGCAARLTAPGGPLAALLRHPRRLLLRRTRDYYEALNRSLQPRHLRDGVNREALLARCLGDTPHVPEGATAAATLAAEVGALAGLDIPRFAASPSAVSRQAALARAQRRLESLGQGGADRLASRIRLALAASILGDPGKSS